MATDYSILDFARQAQQTKGRLKNINGQINVKWSVGILSVNFHGKFALKFEMRQFNESLHSSEVNIQAN